MKIAILGAGAYGRALGKIVSNNGHDLDFYDPKVCPDVSLEQATRNADAIIICIPSNFLPSFLEDYPAELKALPTFLASKGLGDVKIFKDFTNFAVLSGPTFAQEIMDGKQSMLTATNQLAVDIFTNQQIRTYRALCFAARLRTPMQSALALIVIAKTPSQPYS